MVFQLINAWSGKQIDLLLNLLLPRKMVEQVVYSASLEHGITRNIGQIYIDGKDYNYETLNYISNAIANEFTVSKTVAKIRLKELNIIIDKRT